LPTADGADDHRLVDGADAARVMARLKDALEQPLLPALEV